MSKSVHLIVLLALILFSSSAVEVRGIESAGQTALDWPQWRGQGRDAVSSETGLIDRWDESGPEVLWRIAAGEGYSSVSVSKKRLYTLWDQDKKQLLVCLDSRNGRQLWSRELGPAFKNHYGNGPRSTPLVDDGIVYAIGTKGMLLAVDQLNGEVVWERNLVKEFQADLPSYGYSSSPLVAADKLVIEAGGAEAAFVAFDKKTGEVAWTADQDRPAYSSPIEIAVDGVSQVVFWSAHGLRSVGSEDGAILWTYSWETFCPASGDPLNTGTPIFIAPDRLFLSSGSGAAVIRIFREQGKFEVEDVWESEEMRSDVNTALLLGDHIYGFDKGTLKSLNASTGEVRWRARGYQRGSLIAADGKLIVLAENGDLALLDANPEEYVERSSASVLQGKNWTSPSLAGGRLYLRNHDEIVCVEMKNR